MTKRLRPVFNRRAVLNAHPALDWKLVGLEGKKPSVFSRFEIEQEVRTEFPFLSFFQSLHTRMEILLGKNYVNRIYIQGDSLIEDLSPPNTQGVAKDYAALRDFCEPYRQKCYFMAVPTRSEFLYLNDSTASESWSQRVFVKDLMERLNGYVSEIDLYAKLTESDLEEVYFHTETLWTAKGAYLGYEAFASKVGLYPKGLEQYNIEIVSYDFQGSLSRSLDYAAGGTDRVELYYDSYLPDAKEVTKISNLGVKTSDSVYFREWLDTPQQQRVFLGEPSPLTRIVTQVLNERKLLLIGDEFANVLAPYFLRNYSEIMVVDLSLLTEDTANQIQPEEYDEILFVYSTKTLSQGDTFANLEMLS